MAWFRPLLVLGALSALALGAGERPPPPLGVDAFLPTPADNPLTLAKIRLGRRLFFDKILSRDASVSCASCHVPELGFTDREPVAVGVDGRRGPRRTPRLINRAWGRSFFWDGRAASLEEQALEPIENPLEMDLPVQEAIARLEGSPEYVAEFQEVFGRPPDRTALAFALASYVRSIVAGDSPYDRYIAGDARALTDQQKQGLEIFRGKGACAVCHFGPNLTDERFHNTGVGWREDPPEDQGRGQGEFKTPTLREVARSGPYMHDGSLETLGEVVEYYDDGGRPNPHLDPEIAPLELTKQEREALVAFLEALTGEIREGR